MSNTRESYMRELGWTGPSIDRILITNKTGAEIEASAGADCVVARIQFDNREELLGEGNLADATLIAAAPDHALICWAMCVSAGRWEPWGDGRGEFCMNGLRHATALDEFGCPTMTDSMREAITKAKGSPS